MSGIGVPELVIIVFIGALLFGAPLLTFFVGYAVGKNRAQAARTPEATPPVAQSTVAAPPVAPSTAPIADPAQEPVDE